MLHLPCGTVSSSLHSSRCAHDIEEIHSGLTPQAVHVHGLIVRIMPEGGCKAGVEADHKHVPGQEVCNHRGTIWQAK